MISTRVKPVLYLPTSPTLRLHGTEANIPDRFLSACGFHTGSVLALVIASDNCKAMHYVIDLRASSFWKRFCVALSLGTRLVSVFLETFPPHFFWWGKGVPVSTKVARTRLHVLWWNGFCHALLELVPVHLLLFCLLPFCQLSFCLLKTKKWHFAYSLKNLHLGINVMLK